MKTRDEHQLTDDELREIVFEKNPRVDYELKQGIITIIKPQDHWIQRFFRKLNFKIPENTYLDLDEYGSFVFQQVNGKRSVYEIGQNLGHKFTEANECLYSRLWLYLNHLEENEQIIKRIS